MSPSTAPLPCSFTRTARILPLSRPHTVTSCAITVPTTSAPSPIRTFGARNSPSIRPKICAIPLHSTLPTIDMSGPMQETVPAVVADSGLALPSAAAECCDCVNVSSAAFASAFLFLPGALLLNMSTPFFGAKIQHAIDPHHYRRTAPHPTEKLAGCSDAGPLKQESAVAGGAEQVRSAPVLQASACSTIEAASWPRARSGTPLQHSRARRTAG